MMKKKEWTVRNTSDDPQSEESGKEKRWCEKWWSNRKGKKGHDGGGGEVLRRKDSKGRMRRKRCNNYGRNILMWCNWNSTPYERSQEGRNERRRREETRKDKVVFENME